VLNGLDLFTGIGGLAVALSPWVRPITYVELDPYCQEVLKERMQTGDLPHAPIWDDVTTFTGKPLEGLVDIITAGWPCQDLSIVKVGDGLDGERSGLFFDVIRLAKKIKPRFIFFENVPAIRTRGLHTVGYQLANAGYDCRWGVVSAFEVGAPHKRDRWFCLAHAHGPGLEGLEFQKETQQGQPGDTNICLPKDWFTAKGGLLRDCNELPIPVDQINALGNAVVPQQAREAFKRLTGLQKVRLDKTQTKET